MRSRWTTSTGGFNEPRASSINFFEDPATHLRRILKSTSAVQQYINITHYETTANSDYDGWQLVPGAQRSAGVDRSQLSGTYTLVMDVQQ